jgi:hypothetical protein
MPDAVIKGRAVGHRRGGQELPARISRDMEKRAGDTSPTSAEQIAVAGTIVNAIPIVCAAPPGIVTRPLATPFNSGFAHPSPD